MKYFSKASYSNSETYREKNHRRIAYDAACEGIVLLENDGTLPIKVGNIALYGPGGLHTIKGGTGSGEVNERNSVTILQGLENAGFAVTNKAWLSDYTEDYAIKLAAHNAKVAKMARTLSISKIMNAMAEQFLPPYGREITKEDVKETEIAIYVVSRQAGEGGDLRVDKGENSLSSTEVAQLKRLNELYKKTILVINTGFPMDLSLLDDVKGLNAIIYFSQLGMEGGTALADILSGKVSPSGRLSSTWAKKYEDTPFSQEYSYLNGNLDDEYYKEGIYVGYRYFDSFGVKPRYEFGYGLSYTTTEITVTGAKANKTQIQVDAKVTNTGKHSSKEVVQLYASCPQGKLNREYQSLVAFGKTKELQPGESQTLTLSFGMKDLAGFSENEASFILEKGEYIFRVGHSSRKTRPIAVVSLDEDSIVSKHQNICPVKEEFEEISPPQVKYNDNLTDPIYLKVKAADIETINYTYKTHSVYHDEKVDAIMKKLTIKDMVDVVVGAGMFSSKNKINVPGSVGNTTSKLYKKGLINVALCDGPAGLRLSRESGVLKDGNTKPYEMPLSFLNSLPGFIKKFLTADPKKTKPVYQFATAFPIGTALAQTWNRELLLSIGRAIGLEMQEYGVTYWLGPAMNIQRNPLCGRNFEYFSEDPLLSGKTAAHISTGVQETEGAYVTIKHFLCNNQEDNRNHVSSNIHERPLREIYLKGFEIAVREGKAKSVMTSYNKVNGVYTPNLYDCCTNVLRNEWGFQGVVMTDWMSTGKNRASAAKSLSAGNDLIMAGMRGDKKDILKAYKSGTLPKEDIERCCANVVRSIVYSNVANEVTPEMFDK